MQKDLEDAKKEKKKVGMDIGMLLAPLMCSTICIIVGLAIEIPLFTLIGVFGVIIFLILFIQNINKTSPVNKKIRQIQKDITECKTQLDEIAKIPPFEE